MDFLHRQYSPLTLYTIFTPEALPDTYLPIYPDSAMHWFMNHRGKEPIELFRFAR